MATLTTSQQNLLIRMYRSKMGLAASAVGKDRRTMSGLHEKKLVSLSAPHGTGFVWTLTAAGEAEGARLYPIDNKVAEIAKEFLGVETLRTRGCDALDFHELGVGEIKAALEAAFRAGQAAATTK